MVIFGTIGRLISQHPTRQWIIKSGSRFWTKHVAASSDGINRVNYRGFSAADKQQLEDYLTYMSALQPTQLSREQQLPYWINLYNALTVRVVLQHPDKDSIKQMKSTLFSFGPWDDEQTTIEGLAVTLNDIEHRILRPIWRDHRIHYAVNCASISCPNSERPSLYGRQHSEHICRSRTQLLTAPSGANIYAKWQTKTLEHF